ncbi:uncharacterized protein Triagg1_9451 [Trichoderma aggressivum f. europaeum]|uniref:DUF6546 domain-containing protein n=1 Tax=Trichoderma aggressivum f. europaeum TaxID=173218 RepID=A0AAE1M0S8_9HYPO|nr:hypothetical protein Triagg1_9451 [Trichoderma aggressivum f. europaeum]
MQQVMNAMQVESPTSTAMGFWWDSLPVEVRQQILRWVILPSSGKRCNGPKVARFATVCREWQEIVETCTFRRLVLDPSSVSELAAIVRRNDSRLGYIRKLWLQVKLARYTCPACDEPEDRATQYYNNTIFTTCIQSLLETLKLWDPARHGVWGITLTLSISSPSDTEHRLNRFEIKDDYPFLYAEDLDDLKPSIFDFHKMNAVNPMNIYFHGDGLPPLYNEHITRIQGTPLRLQAQRNNRGRFVTQHKTSLPAVPMIKGLVIRRQFRREIHVGSLSQLLGQSFIALEWLRFERTISLNPCQQMSFDRGFQLQLLPSLPTTLRQLSLTQWEIPKTELLDYVYDESGSQISMHATEYLPQEMAKLCTRLEHFCPPWQMDTAAFLQFMIKPDTPSNMAERKSSLKRAILRCPLPNLEHSGRDFVRLVILAAKAALHSLPQLEVMELWGTCVDGEEGSAYIFRYMYETSRSSIVWRSLGNTMLAQTRVLAQWGEVAREHHQTILTSDVTPFLETKMDVAKSKGTCVFQHLLLKDLVFDPITQKHLEIEAHLSPSQLSDPLDANDSSPELLPIDLEEVTGVEMDDDLASLEAEILDWEASVVL